MRHKLRLQLTKCSPRWRFWPSSSSICINICSSHFFVRSHCSLMVDNCWAWSTNRWLESQGPSSDRHTRPKVTDMVIIPEEEWQDSWHKHTAHTTQTCQWLNLQNEKHNWVLDVIWNTTVSFFNVSALVISLLSSHCLFSLCISTVMPSWRKKSAKLWKEVMLCLRRAFQFSARCLA